MQLICRFIVVLLVSGLLLNAVRSRPLDIIAGKSGEEQVKEALDRAEKESEQAAKEKNDKSITAKLKQETEQFLSSDERESDTGSKLTRSSTDLKATLDKKVEELAKFHEKHSDHKSATNNLIADKTDFITQTSNKLKSNELSEITKGDNELSDELNIAENKEKENAALEDESDKKMVEMAKKLNNLVLKFQKKMGRLQHRPKNAADLLPEKDRNDESTVKSIRGKPATHAPIDLAALKNALGLLHTSKSDSESSGTSSSSATTGSLLGMKSNLSKDKSALGASHEPKLPYKEDTKLEDRLAMEAEEEKKFSNGDTYDDGEGEEKSSSSNSKDNSASSLSPKEQASQEMQSYNALISTESNRELSQIQEEITKATQSSMGQVSVVGQKEQVNTEPPSLPNLGSLGSDSGGGGGLDNSFTAALGGVGGLDGLSKSVETLGGGADDQFQGLQGGSQPSTENLEPSSSVGTLGGSESSTQQTSSIGDQNLLASATGGQQSVESGPPANGAAGAAPQVGDGNQQPIEIGGSQEPVEMGTLNSNNNLFSGNTDQLSQSVQNSISSSFGGGSQQSIELGDGGGGGAASQGGLDQQQSMSFKKSKISGEKSKTKSKQHKNAKRKKKHNR